MRAPRTQAAILAVVLSATIASAQTKITPPKNKYDPQDDVKLGREAAAQVEQQLPLLMDDNVNSYVSDIGQRLAAVIPAELQHPEFRYTFKVVNVKEINAFALPGGPMYVNRGMIEAAKNEGDPLRGWHDRWCDPWCHRRWQRRDVDRARDTVRVGHGVSAIQPGI